MNILFVAPMPMVANEGGIQRVSNVLAKQFASKGNRVQFLCYRQFNPGIQESIIAPQNCIEFTPDDTQGWIEKYIAFLHREQVDCVIFQWVDNALEYWLKNTPHRIKIITALHVQPFPGYYYCRQISKYIRVKSMKSLLWKFTGIFLPSAQRLYTREILGNKLQMYIKYSDRVCLLSPHFEARIRSILPELDCKKFAYISNPLDSIKASQADFKSKENLIIMVCRVENDSKNVFGFVDVWQKIAEANKTWKAMLIGDGVDLNRVKTYASKHRIPRIEFVGHQSDVHQFYNRAKIQLITSFSEGFSMVMVEGMAAGCVPIVFNTFESVRDSIQDGKNGIIVNALNNQEMADKTCELINDCERLKQMSEEAIKKVKQFAADGIADNWIELINSISK